MAMTEKTLRTLLRKSALTSKQRTQVLREANRLLNRSINCFYALQDACDTAAEEIMKDEDVSEKNETHADRLEDVRDEFEQLVETLDNLDIPDLSEVR
jgi:hypothetical protein